MSYDKTEYDLIAERFASHEQRVDERQKAKAEARAKMKQVLTPEEFALVDE